MLKKPIKRKHPVMQTQNIHVLELCYSQGGQNYDGEKSKPQETSSF